MLVHCVRELIVGSLPPGSASLKLYHISRIPKLQKHSQNRQSQHERHVSTTERRRSNSLCNSVSLSLFVVFVVPCVCTFCLVVFCVKCFSSAFVLFSGLHPPLTLWLPRSPNPSWCHFLSYFLLLLFLSNSIHSLCVISEPDKRRKRNMWMFVYGVPLPVYASVSAQVCGSLCLMPVFGVIAIRVLGNGQSCCRWD